ncbi:MAG: polyphenol oxidase family protein [Propionibacteriaceae bacterium]|nr:polyphenol oxidase family protein [Propionibacteriaceae bacterium]
MTFSTWIDAETNSGVGVAFTDRFGGHSLAPYDSWNLGRRGLDDQVDDNFALLKSAVRCDQIAISAQVHGTHVERVDSRYPFLGTSTGSDPEADALITRDLGVALVTRVADCVPVLLADPRAGVIGAAHAGRVGLLAGVIQETVRAMRAHGAQSIQAWIGPHICVSCYEVPAAMANHAWEILPATRGVSRQGSKAIDLGEGAVSILEAEHVSVTRCDPCTACDPRFFSHRRDHGKTGRQAGVIWRDIRVLPGSPSEDAQ